MFSGTEYDFATTLHDYQENHLEYQLAVPIVDMTLSSDWFRAPTEKIEKTFEGNKYSDINLF